MRYQVISMDYNGSTTILSTKDSMGSAIDQIKAEVTDLNFNNALTTDNKFKSIEAYFPQFIDSSGAVHENVVYAGKTSDGSRHVYAGDDKGDVDDSYNVRFYVGNNEGNDYFLEDNRENQITDWDSEYLDNKTFYFVKAIN